MIICVGLLYVLTSPGKVEYLRETWSGSAIVDREGVQYVDIIPDLGASISTADKRIFFIGNSHTFVNEVPRLAAQIAKCFGQNIWFETALVGGRRLKEHALSPYVQGQLREKKWDYVIIQPASTEPIFDQEEFKLSYRTIEEQARKNGAQAILYCPWGRDEHSDPEHLYQQKSWAGIDFYDMTDKVDRSCRNALNRATLAPVGAIWSSVLRTHRGIRLHSQDGNHAAISGSFLAALVLYHALDAKADLRQCPFLPAGVSADLAVILRQEALRG